MTERWRSPAMRLLASAVRAAGGTVERAQAPGRILVTGPLGSVRMQELGGQTRRDLRRSGARRLIADGTGLELDL